MARTGYAQLAQLPRYLAGIERRLEKLPTNVQRDSLSMAVVQGLEDDYDDAVAALVPGRGTPPGAGRGALDDRGTADQLLCPGTGNGPVRF